MNKHTVFLSVAAIISLSANAFSQESPYELYGDVQFGGADMVCKYDEANSRCESGPCGRLIQECFQVYHMSFKDKSRSTQRNSSVDQAGKKYYPVLLVGNHRLPDAVYSPFADSARDYFITREDGSHFHRIVKDDEGRSYFEYEGVNASVHKDVFTATGVYKWTTKDNVEHKNTFAWKCRSPGHELEQNKAYFELVKECQN